MTERLVTIAGLQFDLRVVCTTDLDKCAHLTYS
jgi:hypothetical protein